MAFPNEELWSDIIECSICTKVMSDPRALPCLHTFCLKCIEKHGRRQSHQDSGNQSNCPLCRQLFAVSGRNYSNLPKNFYIAKLLEARKDMLKELKRKKDKSKASGNQEINLEKKIADEKRELTSCSEHPHRDISMYCRSCKLLGCVICLQFHRTHIWDEVGGELNPLVKLDSHDLDKLLQENNRSDNRGSDVKDRIRLLAALHSMETMTRVSEKLVAEKEKKREAKSRETKFFYFVLVIIVLAVIYDQYKKQSGSPNMIHSGKIHQDYDALVSCKLGSHLISCNNGFPVDSTSCKCQDVAKDGAKCRAICTKSVISNFEILAEETNKVGEPIRTQCFPGSVVLGCHVWPVLDMLPEDSVYFPSGDGKSCICHGLPGTLCIATCGVADAQHYEVLKQSGTGNIPVSCPENSRVFGCGVSPYMRVETRMMRRSAINAHFRSCQCSDTDLTTCYAICGKW